MYVTNSCYTQRNIDIAKERDMSLPEILSHDLITTPLLFDGDLPKNAEKSKLMDEIEPSLNPNLWNRESPLRTHVIYRLYVKNSADTSKFANWVMQLQPP